MKKSIRTLIIAIILLILLGIGYYFAVKWTPDNDKSDITESESNSQYVTLLNTESDSVKSVTINNGDLSYMINNGESKSLTGYASAILDESSIDNVFYAVLSLTGEALGKDLTRENESYGLTNSTRFITAESENGEIHRVVFGSSSNFDGKLYAAVDDEDTVYTVSESAVEAVLRAPSDLRSKQICTIDNTSITKISLSRGGSKILELEYAENENEDEASLNMPSYTMNYPYSSVKASSDRVNELLEALTSLSATEICEENSQKLSAYGLDKPMILTLENSDGKHIIKIGAKCDNGYYLMYNDVPVVYAGECSFAAKLASLNAADYIDRFIHIFNISDISNMNIRTQNGEYNLKITGDVEKETAKYYVNDKKVSEKSFKTLYQSIIGVLAADTEEKLSSDALQYEISFTFKNKKTKTFKYYRHNERYSVVRADSGLIQTTLTDNLKNIETELDKITK